MKKIKHLKVIIAAALILCALIAYTVIGFNQSLTTTLYTVTDSRITADVKLCLLTDFHSCDYGENCEILISEIDNAGPDVILLAGDIMDDVRSDENSEILFKYIGKKYPCYYVTGNHEFWAGKDNFEKKMRLLEDNGIKRLSRETVLLDINGQKINLCGIDDPQITQIGVTNSSPMLFDYQIDYLAGHIDNDYPTVLLTHRPEYISMYLNKGYDLVLAGHAHGGQLRFPPFIKGIYAPGQGLFPKYTKGQYSIGETKMIVSAGLAAGDGHPPRFYNPPEIVIINLKGE